jgi:hypothetical protein
MERTLVFSVTREDCDWQVFRAGGKGGQNQNKTSSGVRCIHRASGARGEARDTRSQEQNRRLAFARMAADPRFETWRRLEFARRVGIAAAIDAEVAAAMSPEHLRVEVKHEGRWMPEETADAHRP